MQLKKILCQESKVQASKHICQLSIIECYVTLQI